MRKDSDDLEGTALCVCGENMQVNETPHLAPMVLNTWLQMGTKYGTEVKGPRSGRKENR